MLKHSLQMLKNNGTDNFSVDKSDRKHLLRENTVNLSAIFYQIYFHNYKFDKDI